jgi:hypothetical protein
VPAQGKPVAIGARGKGVPVGSYYGEPTGVVGLRLFPNPDFDDAFRRPQERTEHPCKALTLLQIPRALCIAPFFIDTWFSW